MDTAIGISGLLVMAMSGKYAEKGFVQSAVVLALCGVVLMGLIYFTIDYYTNDQITGNSFPDTLTFLFAVAVLVLLVNAITNMK